MQLSENTIVKLRELINEYSRENYYRVKNVVFRLLFFLQLF